MRNLEFSSSYDEGGQQPVVYQDWNSYETLNADRLGLSPHSFVGHPSKFTRSDYRRWINATSLDPIDDYLILRHSVCKGMLDVVSILYIPIRSCSCEESHYGGIQFYDRIYRALEGVELLPPHLGFVNGLVISQRPLPSSKSSRDNYVLALQQRLAQQAQRLLYDAAKVPGVWKAVWDNFSWDIKFAACHDLTKSMASLLRFKTSNREVGDTSFGEYLSRMAQDQEKIFFCRGRSLDMARKNPAVEMMVKSGKEVIFMTEALDELLVNQLKQFNGCPFKTVTEVEEVVHLNEKDAGDNKPLLDLMQESLKNRVSKVQMSSCLQNHPCCLLTHGAKPTRTPLSEELVRSNLQNIKLFHPENDLMMDVNGNDSIIQALRTKAASQDVEAQSLCKDIINTLCSTAMVSSGYVLGDYLQYQQDTFGLLRRLGVV